MTPAWHRNYYRRHPLTERHARTLAEIDDEKYRSAFEGPEPGEHHRFALVEALRWVGALLLITLMLTAPGWWALFFT